MKILVLIVIFIVIFSRLYLITCEVNSTSTAIQPCKCPLVLISFNSLVCDSPIVLKVRFIESISSNNERLYSAYILKSYKGPYRDEQYAIIRTPLQHCPLNFPIGLAATPFVIFPEISSNNLFLDDCSSVQGRAREFYELTEVQLSFLNHPDCGWYTFLV